MIYLMAEKILLGYTGSMALGISTFYQIRKLKEKLKKNPKNNKIKQKIKSLEEKRKGTPVYVSKEKYKQIKEHQKLHEYDYLLE